ncbi:MAG: phage tail tape measure protein [Lachnospiraceae bacterium]|nr:phage tail tape measure protein [Lachnospiraceae bacterium]
MANVNLTFGIEMDKSSVTKAQADVQKLIKSLQNELQQGDFSPLETKKYQKSIQELIKLNESLGKSYVDALEKFNVDGFLRELKRMDINLDQLQNDIEELGYEGYLSMEKFTKAVKNNQVEIQKTDTLLEKTATTLGKTFAWSMANRAVDTFTNSVSSAIRFIYDLDESLNNIRVVTNMNASEMDNFAKKANDVAQALGQTTVAYTEGALLYLQQGKSMEEAAALTEATLIASNITGESTAQTAELLTAAMNGYNLAATEAMNITDKFAAVGAATGADFYELATGMSRVASMANTVGIGFDSLNAQIATISSVTREAPETIGTALKTIYARMSQMKIEGSVTDEDGITYTTGKAAAALEAVGISILEVNGEMREMEDVVTEVGNKWDGLTQIQKVAVAEALAGKQQLNKFIALFNNWDMYQDALATSINSTGAAMEQNEIRMDSLEYKTNQLKATTEELFLTVINSDLFKGLIDGATVFMKALTGIFDILGDMTPLLTTLGVALSSAFSTKYMYQLMDITTMFKESISGTFKEIKESGSLFGKTNEKMAHDTETVFKSIVKNTTALEDFAKAAKLPEERFKALQEQVAEYSRAVQDESHIKSMLENVKGRQEEAKATQELASIEFNRAREEVVAHMQRRKQHVEYMDDLYAEARAKAEMVEDEVAKANKIASLNRVYDRNEDGSKSDRLIEREKNITQALKEAQQARNEALKKSDEARERYEIESQSVKQLTEQLEQAQNRVQSYAGQITDMVESGNKAISMTDKLTKAFSYVGTALQATQSITTFINAFDTIEGRGEKIYDSVVSMLSGVAMLIPGFGPIASMAVSALGSVIDKFWEVQTPLEKANEKAKEYAQTIEELNSIVAQSEDIEAERQRIEAMSESIEKREAEIELANKIAELFPELRKGYDLEGNAIIDLTKDYEEYAKAKREAYETGKGAGGEEAAQKVAVDSIKSNYGKENYDAMADVSQVINPYAKEVLEGVDKSVQNLVLSLVEYDKIAKQIDQGTDLENIGAQVQSFLTEALGVADNLEKVKQLPTEYQQVINTMLGMMSQENRINFFDALVFGEDGRVDLSKMYEAFDKFRYSYDSLVSQLANSLNRVDIETILYQLNNLGQWEMPEGITNLYELNPAELTAGFSQAIQNLEENGFELKNVLNNLGIQLTEEQLTLVDLIYGNSETFRAKNLELQEQLLQTKEMFLANYVNPMEFADINEADQVIDSYQKLIDENKTLVELFNEANAIEFEDGHILTSSFADMIDSNTDGLENANDLLLTFNELFEDVSDADLASMFGEDLASNIQELLQITDLKAPFEDWPDSAKEAFSQVYDTFAEFEDNAKSLYIRMNADNKEFYDELRKNNAETFAAWDEAFGLTGQNFQTMAEYQVAVDFWKYQQLSQMSNKHLEFLWQQAIQEGLIDEQTANGELDIEDKKFILMGSMNKDFLTKIIDGKIDELKADKQTALDKVNLTEEELNQVIDMTTDSNTILARDQKNYTDSIGGMMTSMFHKSAEGLRGLGINVSAINGFTVSNTYKATVDNVKAKIDEINASIEKLEGYKKDIEEYEPFNPEDLTFELPTYNPTGSSTTKPGGYTPSKGSSSSGSSSKDKAEKEVEDLEYKKDLYHDIDIELQKIANTMTKLQEQEDDLYGEAKIANMEKQAELLRKQKELTAQKLEIAKQEAAEARKSLAGMGVKFDETGTITNYNEIIKQKTDWANSLTGDAKEQAKEYVKSLQSAIEQYEDLHFNTIIEYESELEELREAVQEKILEALEYKYEVKIDVIADFQEDNDFFTEILEGYEGIDKAIGRTLENFKEQFNVLSTLDEKYKEILNNTELDAITKAEAIEELKKQIMDATLELKDLKEAISDLIQDAISNNLDAVYEQIDAFEAINDEVKDMIDMYELLGGQDLGYINEMLQAQADSNKAQIDALQQSKKLMEDFRDSLEEGTEEWREADKAVKQMDEDIRKLSLDTMKIYREQMENSFNSSLKEIEKSLTNGLGFDKLEKEIQKARKEQEKYYDTVEKSLFAAEMQKDIQAQIAKSSDPKKQAVLQKFYDEEIKTLLEKDNLTAAEVERAKILYDITLKQMALEEAKANKSVMRLVRDASGNWSYQYMADINKVQQAQDDLTSSLDELLAHDKQAFQDTQDEILERRKQFLSDMEEAFKGYMTGEIASKEELQAILSQLELEFNEDMLLLNSEYAENEKHLAESTLGSIMNAYDITFADLNNLTEQQAQIFTDAGIQLGNSWEETIANMTQSNNDHMKALIEGYSGEGGVTSVITTEFGKIGEAAKNYESKVNEVSKNVNQNLDSVKNKTEAVKDETNKVIQAMDNEFKKIKNDILPAYDSLISKYDTMIQKIKDYINELNQAIQKNKDLANTPTPSAPATKPSNSNTSASKPSTSTSSSKPARNPGVGDIVRSVPGTWYSDSYSGAPIGTPSKWAKEFKVTQHKSGRPRPYHIQGVNGGTGSGWVEWVGFKSGGYTGDWSKTGGLDGIGGKAAILHQKEMVLNAKDTENMLKAVEMVRDYTDLLNKPLPTSSLNTNETIEQTVNINADFSGVRNSSEIETAFENLVNKAIQYTRKN